MTMVDPDAVKKAVGRKLRGLPVSDDEAQIAKPEGKDVCRSCQRNPIAEKGSFAHSQGVCVECATWFSRNGEWETLGLLED